MADLDRTDLAILRVLEADARISFAELADRVGLSKTPCWTRVQALERRGVIKGYRAQLEAAALGKGLTVFAVVEVEFARHEAFEAAALRHPAITECHTTAGEGDYLLRMVAADVGELDQLLRKEISQLPGVRRFSTTICMKAIKQDGALTAGL